MTYPQVLGFLMVAMLLVYFAVEFGWGGGDPNHKDHNRPPWYL
jgi:hypothetical protein